MRHRLFDLFGLAVVAAWLAWIGSQALEGVQVTRAESITLSPEDISRGWRDGEEWQGIYLKGQKVGYLKMKKWQEGDLYRIESDMTLHLTVMKTRQKIKSLTKATLDKDMILQDFQLQVGSGPARMEMRGKVQNQVVTLEIDSAGSVQTEIIKLNSPPRLEFSLKPLLMRQDLKVGEVTTLRFFDPTSMAEQDLSIEYRGKETIQVMEQEVQSHHFIQTLAGNRMKLWTNDIGEVLREELPMGLMGLRESSAEARYGLTSGQNNAQDTDIVDAVSVKAKGGFSISKNKVSLRLSGFSFDGLQMNGGRQRWTPAPDKLSGTLELEVEPSRQIIALRHVTLDNVQQTIQGPDAELAAQLKAATEPEVLIQSDHAKIKSKALEIAGVSKDELPQAEVLTLTRKVNAWAHQEIAKQSVVGVPSALETLDNLKGDCNEHATLSVALLRSLGVPARLAVGIAYLPEQERFFYHAWVEVWSERWIAIDPTFGQLPADLGHVRFVVGGLREQFEMFRVIGQLEMQTIKEKQ